MEWLLLHLSSGTERRGGAAPQDPHLHLKHLKPNPVASKIVDHCIECGFCESNCPSRDLTLTPRQRIASYKEIARLEGLENRNSAEDTRCPAPPTPAPPHPRPPPPSVPCAWAVTRIRLSPITAPLD